MVRKDFKHHQAIFDSAAAGNLMTQNNFLTIVVCACIEEESSGIAPRSFADHCINGRGATTRSEDGPTGKATSDFLHVFLGITAVDSHRMQFHQLARVVFIDTPTLLLRRRLSWHWLYDALIHQSNSTSLFAFHSTQNLPLTWPLRL